MRGRGSPGRGGARGGELVEVVGGGELDGLEVHLGGVPPMTIATWYGGQAAVPSERSFSLRNASMLVSGWPGFLEEIGLVGRAAAFGEEEELILIALPRGFRSGRGGCCRCSLLEHLQRGDLGVAEVLLGIGFIDARERSVSSFQPVHTRWPLLARRAVPVSWHIGKREARGDGGVAQEGQGDGAVVGRGVGVVEDRGQLGEMAGPQQVVDVDHRLLRRARSAPRARRPGCRGPSARSTRTPAEVSWR